MTEQEYLRMLECAVADKAPFAPMEDGKPETGKWTRIPMPEYTCANGEPYCCYLKKGTLDNLIIFMVGGGLLWDAASAVYPADPKTVAEGLPGLYTSPVTPANEYWFFASKPNNGILSEDEGNPFRDWSIGMVNYGTGDLHLGSNELIAKDLAGKDITVHCRGFKNMHAWMHEGFRGISDQESQEAVDLRGECGRLCSSGCGGGNPGLLSGLQGCNSFDGQFILSAFSEQRNVSWIHKAMRNFR